MPSNQNSPKMMIKNNTKIDQMNLKAKNNLSTIKILKESENEPSKKAEEE
jgi:hypothetical protein